jgi:FHS family L-fucose permease-like MFS transporter
VNGHYRAPALTRSKEFLLAIPIRNVSAPGAVEDVHIQTDTRAMAVATGLFFMVGFLTCLNDIVIPHLKSIFDLNYAEAMSVQFAFFTSYAVFSYPSGALVEKFGYKKTMVIGLLVMALGAAGFIPAAKLAVFFVFLGALIVLAAGMTVVQVAVNPYVTVIGPAATASSRLNLAQAFNSFGTFIAPFLGGLVILGGAAQLTPERMHTMDAVKLQAYRELQAHSVILPYLGMAVVLVLLAIALAAIKLQPRTSVAERTQDFRPGAFSEALTRPDRIWDHPWLLFGAVGIFTYVGAEVTLGSLLVLYMGLPQIAGLRESAAAEFLMVYWGGAMVGRFIGSGILQRVRTGPLLAFNAIIALVLVIASMLTRTTGAISLFPVHLLGWHWTFVFPHSWPMWTMLAVGLFNSIMFPSIFTLGIQDLGPLTSKGSSLLIAAIVGGAIIPEVTGKLADSIGLHPAFIVPAICYVYIACYGIAAIKRPQGSDRLLPVEPV